jgi:hypothetical protein
MARRHMCLHHVYEDVTCEKCERQIERGVLSERLLYSQQRVWQLEQKTAGKCEICGKRKDDDKSRCVQCLARDTRRHKAQYRKTNVRKWKPGGRGRPPVHVKGGIEKYIERLPELRKRAAEMTVARKAQNGTV